jgi:hypothetical protein
MIHIELTGSTRLVGNIGSIRLFFKREYTHKMRMLRIPSRLRPAPGFLEISSPGEEIRIK